MKERVKRWVAKRKLWINEWNYEQDPETRTGRYAMDYIERQIKIADLMLKELKG